MTRPAGNLKAAVRVADLGDAAESARIDAFVRADPMGTPFHLTAWQRAVARGCGQLPHYLVAEDKAGAIAGILPLTEVHSPIFGRALVSAGFAVDGGVLAGAKPVADSLVAAAEELARRHHCPTIELRGGTLPGKGWLHDRETYLGFVQPLAGDDDAQLLAIPRKQRAEVRRALGLELEVTTGSATADLDAHFRVYAESVRNLGTPVFPARLFSAMLDEFGEDADILTVRHAGRPVASVLSFYFNNTVYPYWGGGIFEARRLRGNDLMYYALMCHARASKGCHRFDFGRSKVGTGAADFKRNWGFEGRPLAYAKKALDGQAPREINPLDPRYRLQVALWQKLPLALANRLGPLISRGLG